MNKNYRIGLRILPSDPFWVQVREAAIQRAQQQGLTIVPLAFAIDDLSGEAMVDLLDDLMAQELDAFIGQRLPRRLSHYLLSAGLPIVYAEETNLRDPRLTAPRSLYAAAQMAAHYLAESCRGPGRCIMIAGDDRQLPTVVTRISGFHAAMRKQANLTVQTLYAPWRYEEACAALRAQLTAPDAPWDPTEPVAAIFGHSDPLALAAVDVGRELGFVNDRTCVAGINGDPLALAAIVEGRMHATVETAASALGRSLIEYACRGAAGETLPDSFPYQLRLVTHENVAQVSAEKLIAIAELPSRLVDVNRRQEEQRVRQLETSLAINQRVGGILDGSTNLYDLADLVRHAYAYDAAQLFLWNRHDQTLVLEPATDGLPLPTPIPLNESAALGQALLQNRPVYIPDTERSQRFAPDPYWPATRSRVILPIRQGQRTLGVLDLHSRRRLARTQAELDGLQILADQLGSAMQNRRLYGDALAAKSAAEQASQLKTRLLANVSHELRTPLNVILGYSSAALEEPNPYDMELPAMLRKDLHRIEESSEHLVRLINDLLDLSQAESGTLTVYPELIETGSFLTDLFESVSTSLKEGKDVLWQLQLSEQLPPIMADPVRLRQILLNLLSNAAKFTRQGRIALGAMVGQHEVHIWVEDTGRGIPADLLGRISEAFVTAEATMSQVDRTREGVGLGLNVTQQLVRLHGGTLKIDSLMGYGTTCHLYWPLTAERIATPPAHSLEPSNEPLAALLAELTINAGPLVQRTTEYIHAHFDREITRQELADEVGVSPNYVTRVFRRETGLTPWQYLNRYRVARAQQLLRTSSASITAIAATVGFNDPAYFSRIFSRESGKPPLAFRDETI